jgi:hypothetical protein
MVRQQVLKDVKSRNRIAFVSRMLHVHHVYITVVHGSLCCVKVNT